MEARNNMRAIITKYHGPTNGKGSRISADDGSNRVYVPYDHASNDPYRKAALKLCRKIGYTGKLVCGGRDWGKVFVFLPENVGILYQWTYDKDTGIRSKINIDDVLDLSMSDADIEKQSSM